MGYAKHIIKRQVIKLEMARSLNRTDVQNRVSRIYQEQIVLLIDELLTAKSAASHLVIDRLEINLGHIPVSELEEVLAEKIEKALQEKLDKIIVPPVPENIASTKTFTAQTISHSDEELIMYFLQTGVFPWWAQETTYAWLEKTLYTVLKKNTDTFRRKFLSVVRHEEVVKRLMYTFRNEVLTGIIAQLIGYDITIIQPQKEQLFNVFGSELSTQQLREYWWTSICQIIADASIRSHKDLFEAAGVLFVRFVAQKIKNPDLLRFLQLDRTSAGIIEKITSFYTSLQDKQTNFFSKQNNEETELSSPAFDVTNRFKNEEFAEPVSKPQQPSLNPELQKSVQNTTPFTDIDKIYIQNAGLVLLWPFLHRFFQNMGLADDEKLTSEANANFACLLLQYLVTGSTEDLFEAQLPLNKMLCGIPLLQPIDTFWNISDEDTTIAEHFLLAAIQNGGEGWKNLSVAGFRQAYLVREGIISGRDGNWLLQVKRETYDMLVDRLPWTVQVVKLPWMERLIFVEW